MTVLNPTTRSNTRRKPAGISSLPFIVAGDALILVALAVATVGQAGIQQCGISSVGGSVNPGTTICPDSLVVLAFAVGALLAGSLLVALGLPARGDSRRANSAGPRLVSSMVRTDTASRFLTIGGIGLAILGLTTQFVAPYFSCFQIRGGVCGASIPSGWLPVPLGVLVLGLIVLVIGVIVGGLDARRNKSQTPTSRGT